MGFAPKSKTVTWYLTLTLCKPRIDIIASPGAISLKLLQLGTVVEVTIALAGFHFDVARFISFWLKFTSAALKLALFEAFLVLLQNIVEYHFIPL
jgi:hypothetical protein